MPENFQSKNKHLIWRAGFGPAIEHLSSLNKLSPKQYFDKLVNDSAGEAVKFNFSGEAYKAISDDIMLLNNPDENNKKQLIKLSKEGLKTINIGWLNEMVSSKAQLREKMAFFWHGHFACRSVNIFHAEKLINTIREHALGDFRKLLFEVSKSAVMIYFLNNQQNRKDHPNENFAREVMELFTLGRGNYTEKDIKESARAFTGWGADRQGSFVFRPLLHDSSEKIVLSKKGNFKGEDILNILLDQKQTAHFIAGKMYRFFVNENPNAETVKWLGDRFYQHYNISKLAEDIFTSSWFFDSANIGAKIKSPIELIAGILRILPMEIDSPDVLLLLQRLLGQSLFNPPNVAGWPGGKSWIDSSSLMLRMRLPQLFNDVDELNVNAKTDDDQMMGQGDGDMKAQVIKYKKALAAKKINANINWEFIAKNFGDSDNVVQRWSEILLQVQSKNNHQLISKHTSGTPLNSSIKTAAIQIMSTPEYQLC